MNNVQKIVKEICDELDIKFTLVSQNWIMVLEKDEKIKYVVGFKFPLNDQACGKVCDDKYALYEVMNKYNIPVTEHYIVHKNYDRNRIIDICSKYNNGMVIKSNLGTCGSEVFHRNNIEDIFNVIDELLVENLSISLCPYYDIKTEYRSIVFNDNIELVYGKIRPIVKGNGKSTIYELLLEFNKAYFEKIECTNELNRVLLDNEIYEYNWQFNLSKGAMPFFLNDEEKENTIKEMALRVSRVLGVGFASIDIVELYDGTLLVLEANSGVMMNNFSVNLSNGKDIAKDIYTKVLKEMFK